MTETAVFLMVVAVVTGVVWAVPVTWLEQHGMTGEVLAVAAVGISQEVKEMGACVLEAVLKEVGSEVTAGDWAVEGMMKVGVGVMAVMMLGEVSEAAAVMGGRVWVVVVRVVG